MTAIAGLPSYSERGLRRAGKGESHVVMGRINKIHEYGTHTDYMHVFISIYFYLELYLLLKNSKHKSEERHEVMINLYSNDGRWMLQMMKTK